MGEAGINGGSAGGLLVRVTENIVSAPKNADDRKVIGTIGIVGIWVVYLLICLFIRRCALVFFVAILFANFGIVKWMENEQKPQLISALVQSAGA